MRLIIVILALLSSIVIATDDDLCIKKKKLEKKLRQMEDIQKRKSVDHGPKPSKYNEYADFVTIDGEGKLTNSMFFTTPCFAPENLARNCKSMTPEELKNEATLFSEFNNGRLANQMSAFATMYGLGKLADDKVQIALQYPQYQLLSSVFPHFEENYIDYLLGAKYCGATCSSLNWRMIRILNATNEQVARRMKGVSNHFATGRAFKFHTYLNEPAFYKDHLKQLRKKEFVIRDELMQRAKSIVAEAKSKNPDAIIGIHVRLTDYINHLHSRNAKWARSAYYKKAIEHFLKMYKNPRFLIVSDDKDSALKDIKDNDKVDMFEFVGTIDEAIDKKVSRMASTGIDMGVLALCDHLILSHGTFGIWAAFLNEKFDNMTIIMAHNLLGPEAKLKEIEEVAVLKKAKFENFLFIDGVE